MVTLKLGIVLMFAVCYSDEELTITYINNSMSWNNAASYCFENDGILESNENIVQTYSINMTNEDIWIGRYNVLTDWAGIWGCYTLDITSTKVTPVSFLDHLECQRRCPITDYDFFSVKDSTCYCLKERNLKNSVPFGNCNCSNCGHMYFVIFKQNIHSDKLGRVVIEKDDGLCMAAQCTSNSIKLSNEMCNHSYAVICQDYKNLEIAFLICSRATQKCSMLNSYIKWYSSELCSKVGNRKQHWTSIKREDKMFGLTIYDKGIHISPLKCRISQVSKGNSDNRELTMAKCNELHSFFCRFGISTDQIVTPVNNGTITGVVVAVIAVILIVVVLTVIIYIRRKKSRIPAVTKSNHDPSSRVNERVQENRESTLYTEISSTTDTNNKDTHNTLVYSYAESLNSEKYRSPISENLNSGTHGGRLQTAYNITDKHGSSENRGKLHTTYNNTNYTMHNNPDHNPINNAVKTNDNIHEDQNSTYSLAKRIDEDDEPDPYTTNIDYDHLSNVSKKEENTKHKIYDHLHLSESGGCDPTYDHSNINGSISTDSNYDHFSKADDDLF